jgi:hypothetical protein
VEDQQKKQSLLPDSLHIYLIMAPQTEQGNPMAISSLLNPSDDEDDAESLRSEPDSVERSMDSLEISRRHSQPHYENRSFSDNRLTLPLRPINPRRGLYDRSGSYEDCSRRRYAASTGLNRYSSARYRGNHGPQHHHSRQRSAPPPSSSSRHPTDRVSKTPHSNKAYTSEQVHFIRYTKEDLGVAWKGHPARFRRYWRDNRESDQCFSSRYYRCNIRPRHVDWVPILVDGRPVMDPAPVRGRSTPEGKAMDFPYTLIELFPHRALEYSWVSPADKARAMDILRQDEIRDAMIEKGTFVDPDPKNSKSPSF